MINGMLNIDKPEGITSFDVVYRIKKVCKSSKAGHTGTLDPFASGVLLICLNEATKVVPILVDHDKEYIATMRLGKVTDTQDLTGKVISVYPVEPISDEKFELILNEYKGTIEQIPPMYSALHYKGERLYELARKQKEVVREPRKINIKKITVLDRTLTSVKLYVKCSKGTYIRTLCHDIGMTLGCGAYLENLVRESVGNFSLENSIKLREINEITDIEKHLIPTEDILDFESITIKQNFEKLVKNGVPLDRIHIKEDISNLKDETKVKIFSFNKELLAVGEKSRYNTIIIKRGFNL